MDSQSKAISRRQSQLISIKFKLVPSKHGAGFFSSGSKCDLANPFPQSSNLNFGSYAITDLRNRREVLSVKAIDSSFKTGTLKLKGALSESNINTVVGKRADKFSEKPGRDSNSTFLLYFGTDPAADGYFQVGGG
jgi:hypothetical protein